MTGEIGMSGLSSEISSADFGDRRLAHRLQLIVRRLWEQPSSSFPQAMATDAELEATYRFLSNERVSAARILEPHHESTAKRVSSKERVVVVHDTTEFEFGGEVQREGLGRLIRPGQGFFHLVRVSLLAFSAWRRFFVSMSRFPTRREKTVTIAVNRLVGIGWCAKQSSVAARTLN